MPEFIFAYHGGGMPDTPEEGAKVMAAWQAWYGAMGDAVVNGGAPVGMSKTVTNSGVADDGGHDGGASGTAMPSRHLFNGGLVWAVVEQRTTSTVDLDIDETRSQCAFQYRDACTGGNLATWQ